MESTSTAERAAEILKLCLEQMPVPDELLRPLVQTALGEGPAAEQASRCLFTDVVETLADRFERSLCDAYANVFSQVLAMSYPDWDAEQFRLRYERVRQLHHYQNAAPHPERVFVLSRVTLGADVAITSTVLDAAKKRFPEAQIHLVGGRKSWELFAGDSRIQFHEARYRRRGTLRERLEAGRALRARLSEVNSLVIDPDSRLTQLGLLPVCREQNYYFFESRSFGGESEDALSQLTKRWVAEVLGVVDALPYIAPTTGGPEPHEDLITVSLGVGENLNKRLPDPFEGNLFRELRKIGLPILADLGAEVEEADRVKAAIRASGAREGEIEIWEGAFAPFAARIAASRLFIGYDSAGQHVAAASKTPVVSVFAGAPTERFRQRWRPVGSGRAKVVTADGESGEQVLRRTITAAGQLLLND